MATRLLPFALASVLLGCHPQAAVPATAAQLPALDRELFESSLRPWIGSLSVCLADADVVPGQRAPVQMAAMQLSINDAGHVQSVTLQKVDDPDLNECIV